MGVGFATVCSNGSLMEALVHGCLLLTMFKQETEVAFFLIKEILVQHA